MVLGEYEDPTANNGKGITRNVKGNSFGPNVNARIVDENGDPVDPATSIKLNEPIPLESFDETDLVDGSYTVVTTDTVSGFGIHNNSTENSLTFTINSVNITVGAGASFYFAFAEYTTITVSGTSLDFNAFVAGFTN